MKKQSCDKIGRERNHLQVQREFEATLAYIKPCLRKQKTMKY